MTPPALGRRRRAVVVLNVVLWGAVLAAGAWYAGVWLHERAETERAAPPYDPPVMAGQDVIRGCSGGFYARQDRTIVLTHSAHCSEPGIALRDDKGLIGLIGPRAQLEDCPQGRFCAPSDFMTLAVAANRIPWGHLNEVDMGAGGYRTLPPGTPALACEDVRAGQAVEINGREHYRTGTVLAIEPYEFETDTMFPCMIIVNIPAVTGDSGAAVLVDGQPAGIVARRTSEDTMGFTPLAEGLQNLGLTLCTTPDCDLSPEIAEQPSD